jgi:hypothetical protein
LLSTITWASNVSGDWDNPAMWIGGAVPGPSDDAIVGFSDITVTVSGSDSAGSLNSEAGISVNNGSLTLSSASEIDGGLSVYYGALTEDGGLEVGGLTTLSSFSTLSGAPGSVVEAYGGVLFTGYQTYPQAIVGCDLNNHATATYAVGSGVSLLDGAAFYNLGGATFQDSVGTSFGGDGTGAFNNAGSYVTTGEAASVFAVPFVNTGTVDAQAGSLTLQSGCGIPLASDASGPGRVTGSFYGAPGTTMNLGYEDLATTASVTGDTVSIGVTETSPAGQVRCPFHANNTTACGTFTNPNVSVGNLTVAYDSTLDFSPNTGPQTLPIGNLSFVYYGVLQGSDNFAVSGTLTTANGGTILGTAGSSLTANDVTIVPGSLTLDGRAVTATGTVTWESSPSQGGEAVVTADGTTFTSLGMFIDQADGTNQIWGTQYTNGNGVGTGAFLNDGSYLLAGGAAAEFRIPFSNDGTVDVQAGTLNLDDGAPSQPTDPAGPGTITGSFIGAPGTTMNLGYEDLATTASVTGDTVSIGVTETSPAGQVRCPFHAKNTTACGMFTNPNVSVGNLTVAYDSTLDFSPNTGPQTLPIGNLSFIYYGILQGTDNFAVSGTLTTDQGCTLLGSVGTSLTADNITIVPGSITLDGRAVTATGTVTWESDPTVIEESVATADGSTFTSEGTFIDQAPAGAGHSWGTQYPDENGIGTGSFTNLGSYVKQGPAVSEFRIPFNNSGSINVQAGTLNLSAARNSRTVTVASGAILGSDGYAQDAGATILSGGTLNGGTFAVDGGTLSGFGIINASVVSGGQVVPGATGAAGLLTINGDYTQNATGILDINIGGTTAGNQYGLLAVSGVASLAGTVNVATINAFQPAFGNSFQVLTFGSSSGNFATYNAPSLASGLFLDSVFSPTSLTLDIDRVAIGGAPAFPLEGVPINLTATVTGPSAGNSFTFAWTVTQNTNPFASGSGSTFSFTPNLNGTYVVTLSVSDVAGGKGMTSLQLIVAPTILVLDPSAGGALSLSGNASVNIPGALVVDSSSSSALSASGNATAKAAAIDVHGGLQKSGNASFSPVPVTGAATIADPLAGLALPTAPTGTPASVNLTSGSLSISQGVYSQIKVSGNAKLTLGGGIYIIEGGGLSVSGNASISGSSVTIFNAGSNYPSTGGTYGSIALSGNGSYSLTPPNSGTYAGVVIFQPRDNTRALTISGNASVITGTIFAPAAALSESGNAQLNASIDVDMLSISGNGVANTVALSTPTGTVAYTPAQIRSAYGINALGACLPTPPSDGSGQTIAIVDAYDDPSIFQAIDSFDTQFGLTGGGPTLYQQYGPASSFLSVLNQYGQATSLPSTDPNGPGTTNWELEEALDVEWAHAIAPGAQIILVEADSQSLSDLMAGVATAAAQPGVSAVSMSWGFAEGQTVFASDEAAYDSTFNVPGVTFVASTGDYAAADPEYPAYSPNVVAVGGTNLTLSTSGSYSNETGWGYYSSAAGALIGSGGGISLYESEPAYQQGVQSTGFRTTPDVSLFADPATGAWIADPFNLNLSSPFEVIGGTSLAAPAWAGLFALVNQGRAAAGESTLNSSTPADAGGALYMLPQTAYNTIASGNNGYSAAAGYNLVTGLGTPQANVLVPDLVAYHGSGTTYSGPTVAAITNAGLVDSGTGAGDATQVFSVFDALMATGGNAAAATNKMPAAGSTSRASSSAIFNHDSINLASAGGYAPASTDAPEAGWLPLDSNAARDAALAAWVPSRMATETPTRSKSPAMPRPVARTSAAWAAPATPADRTALLDRALGELTAVSSLLGPRRAGRK